MCFQVARGSSSTRRIIVSVPAPSSSTSSQEFATEYAPPPKVFAAAKAEQDELGMSFCRGCGYCLPCPAKIDIPNAARMSLMIRRAPESNFLNDDWEEKMNRIDDCISCGHCTGHCPYGLNTPELLRENLLDYREIQKARRTAE